MCVLPNLGSRLVPIDFDAASEGFEEVEMPEQPKMLLASEGGLSGAPLEPDEQEAADQLQEQLGDIFVQAIRDGVADAMREALSGVSGTPVEAVALPDSDDAGGEYA
jgi:hypothetical protein|tara:strand:+ start:370 stop:690 length:321 start_codon:yes stop_codon:yes gene_type:complete